jgi:hypothetical protein
MSKAARTKELIEEIRQIREQYQAEVGSKRKPWPKSIRERIFELRDLDARMPELAKKINIPYQTITSWQRKTNAGHFHALTVSSAPTVTVSGANAPAKTEQPPLELTVTVKTPDGLTIEIPASRAALIIGELRRGR